ncbi:hypothetical protein FRC06_007895 [Ceratobasidium sp. 370]|nr:hypothetical protein FRC06_007895 [Ceratobasidium sp. 370]
MAGKTGAKWQAFDAATFASKLAKRQRRANNDDYPSDLPSKKLTFDQCEWLDTYQAEYKSRVGERGAKNSTNAWVQNTIVPDFLEAHFPTLSLAICEQFKAYMDKVINTRFNNNAHLKSGNLFYPTVFNKLTHPEHLWGHDHPDDVDKIWIPMIKEKPELCGNVLEFWMVVCNLFKALPAEVKELYLQKFQDRKRDIQAGVVMDEKKAQ